MFYNIKKSLKNIQIMKIGDISVERPDNETAIHDSSLITEIIGKIMRKSTKKEGWIHFIKYIIMESFLFSLFFGYCNEKSHKFTK